MQEEPVKKSRKLLWIILSIVGVIIIVGGVVAVLYFMNGATTTGTKSSDQNTQSSQTEQTAEEMPSPNKDRAACLAAARAAYVDYLAANSAGGVSQSVLDTATAQQQTAMDKCNKQYPLK